MINKLKPSKKRVAKGTFAGIIGSIFCAFFFGISIASETIDETTTSIDFPLAITIFLIATPVLTLIIYLCVKGVYKNEYYYIDDNKINYEYTFVIKKRVMLPLEKINLVKVKRSILDYIFNTATLEIGSGHTKGIKTEIRLCLDKDYAYKYADYLQNYSDAIKKNVGFNQEFDLVQTKEEQKEKIVFKMDVSDKIKCIIFSKSWIVIPVLLIVLLGLVIANNFWAEPINKILKEGEPPITLDEVIIWYTGIIGTTILVVLISNIIYAFVSFYNYIIEKTTMGIKIEYGLLSRKSIYVQYDKIHGYGISQPLLAQIFKVGQAKLAVVGLNTITGNNSEQNQSVTYLYPYASLEKLQNILNTLLPDMKFDSEYKKTTNKTWIHNILIPYLITILILAPLLGYLSYCFGYYIILISYAVILFFGIIDGLLLYKNARFGINKDYVFAQSGSYIRQTLVVKTKSVQEIKTKAGYIRQKHNVCTYTLNYRGRETANIGKVKNVEMCNLDDLN